MSVNYLKFLEQKFAKQSAELKLLGVKMDGDFKDNQKFEEGDVVKFDALLLECHELKTNIENLGKASEIEAFANGEQKAQPFVPNIMRPLSIGEQFVDSEGYKAAVKSGKVESGMRAGINLEGFLSPVGTKATFTTTSGGMDSTINYVNLAAPIMIEQQRLTIRDLLSTGETTMNAIPYIKESIFVNGADMVGEEGEKPEATLTLTTASAPVKKVAVVLKVTDEMFADFPMMRDYANTRLRFMVEQKEEQQLLNGTGAGNQITGILNSGVQTQPCGSISVTNPVSDSIFKAMTKVRVPTGLIAGFAPDGLVINPTDWQILKLAKDSNNQYFGGGPFTGAYGNAAMAVETFWGLKVVETTAITAGTALVGAFKMGAQLWQREGIRVEATNSNEDDFNFNRVSLRVEERLALTVYRPSAFCTVTSIA